MSLIITGATGRYGGRIVQGLLERGVDPSQIIATGRKPERLAELAKAGVRTAEVDHDAPSTFDALVTSSDTLMLVPVAPGGDPLVDQNRGLLEHFSEIRPHVVYASVARATEVDNPITYAHARTERMLKDYGFGHTVLRNGWFSENYVETIREAAAAGEIASSVGAGRVASAPLADFAMVASAVLCDPSLSGKVYELSGNSAWTFEELAQMIADVRGAEVGYRAISREEYRSQLVSTGMPEAIADLTAGIDESIRSGWLGGHSRVAESRIGRPTTSMRDFVSNVLS